MSLRELAEQATPPGRITDDETEAAVERAAARLYPLAPELALLCADMADWMNGCKGYVNDAIHDAPTDAVREISIADYKKAIALLARFRELEGRT